MQLKLKVMSLEKTTDQIQKKFKEENSKNTKEDKINNILELKSVLEESIPKVNAKTSSPRPKKKISAIQNNVSRK